MGEETPAIAARRAELAAEREAERVRLALIVAAGQVKEEQRIAAAQAEADRKAGYL